MAKHSRLNEPRAWQHNGMVQLDTCSQKQTADGELNRAVHGEPRELRKDRDLRARPRAHPHAQRRLRRDERTPPPRFRMRRCSMAKCESIT
mmetsp:Transcript_15186/g.47412  ORF Transcript_15186/g.47412 Transcript_15186/m.47412 type:complete len:91 (-) Transcript_15186:2015-2287(-)